MGKLSQLPVKTQRRISLEDSALGRAWCLENRTEGRLASHRSPWYPNLKTQVFKPLGLKVSMAPGLVFTGRAGTQAGG